MKFLFTTHPMYGHFHAMAPLAIEAQARGHQVAFASGAGFGDAIRRAGLTAFPCGLDFDGSHDIFQALPEWKSIQARYPASLGVQQLIGFVEALAPKMLDGLIPLVDAWQPDLIIRDPLEYGGYLAAEKAGLPHAAITWAVYIPAQALCPGSLYELRQRYGLAPDPGLESLDRDLVLNFLPHSWDFSGSPVETVIERFCAPPFDQSGNESLPGWVYYQPDRPTVHVTLGTTFNRSPQTFKAILSALSAEKVNVIVTVGRSMDPQQLQPLPGHIKVAQYIPQTLLLPHCDAVVFHGGYNTLHSALWHGLPMVLIPLGGGDQVPNARRCQQLGVGVVVDSDPPDVDELRAAVRAILEQPEYRARARQLQEEMRSLPPLSKAVDRLERLIEAHNG